MMAVLNLLLDAVWILAAAIAVLFTLLHLACRSRRRPNEPPLIQGWIPYLGVALPFGNRSARYLLELQRLHGDIFTLLIAGKRITFLMDPSHAVTVLKEAPATLSSVHAALTATERVVGARKLHLLRSCLDELQRDYVRTLHGTAANDLTRRFCSKLHHFLDVHPEAMLHSAARANGGWVQGQLPLVVMSALLYANTETLFGDGTWYSDMPQHYQAFNKSLPLLLAGVPASLIGVDSVRAAIADAVGGSTVRSSASTFIKRRWAGFQHSNVDLYNQSRLQLAALWVANAHTLNTAFWTLYHIGRDRALQAKLMSEWRQVLRDRWNDQSTSDDADGDEDEDDSTLPPISDGDENADDDDASDGERDDHRDECKVDGHTSPDSSDASNANANAQSGFSDAHTFTPDILRQLHHLESCIQEVLRLYSSTIITRRATADLAVCLTDRRVGQREYAIRQDDYVCVATELFHLDPDRFPEPHEFQHNRFLTADGSTKQFFAADGTEIRHSFLPFGAGAHKCPGRFYAMNMVKLLVMSLLERFELHVSRDTPVPCVDGRRAGLGVMNVVDDVPFQYRTRPRGGGSP